MFTEVGVCQSGVDEDQNKEPSAPSFSYRLVGLLVHLQLMFNTKEQLEYDRFNYLLS